MSWLMGASIGLFMGGPLGAVVGGALQHVMSKGAQPPVGASRASHQGEQIFISHLVAILTKIAMADGSISDHERKTIHGFFSKDLRYRGTELRLIDAMIEETYRIDPDLHEVCTGFDRFANKEQRMLLLDLIYQVVLADHVIAKGEAAAINQVVTSLGIGREEHEHIKSRYTSAKKHDHYAMLGLKHSADKAEIKRAYRQLASQYHPDKVAHLGSELVGFANKKFKEINEAYKAVQKERNF